MTLWLLLGFLAVFLAFLVWLVRRSQKAGEDSLFAKQMRAAEKGKQRVSEAQNRVNGMSDGDVSKRLHDDWTRD